MASESCRNRESVALGAGGLRLRLGVSFEALACKPLLPVNFALESLCTSLPGELATLR